MKNGLFPHFTQALTALGTTDQQRATALGVSRVTVFEYRANRLPRQLRMLMKHPALLRALADDAERQQAVPPSEPTA